MENMNEFQPNQIPEKSPASLTALRLKRVQHFRIVSSMDPAKYGQLGSSKWGDELHRFLADNKISREDVQRWMDTNAQVTEPLPTIRKSEPQTENDPEQQWSFTGRELPTCRHPEVIQIQRPPSPSSSSSSTDSQNTRDTIVSAMNPNYDASTNPISLNDAATPASGFNVQESSGILNLSTAASQTSQSETQNDCMPFDPTLRATVQEPEVSSQEVILKDIAIGFDALRSLEKLAKNHKRIRESSFLLSIHEIYKKLEQFQKNNVVTQAGEETEAIPLSTDSNHEDIGGNFMNNQGDNDQIEGND